MRRRDFGWLVASLPLILSQAGRAQQARGDARPLAVGFVTMLDEASATDFLATLRAGLAAYGYSGPRLVPETRYAAQAPERIAGSVSELDKRGVDVIVTHAAATRFVVAAPRSKPVVIS